MNVQILSKKLITPSSPTPSHFRNYKVSWLSMFQSPLLYLPNIFYYPSSTGGDNIERSRRLQKSLPESLTLLYPFAGRYIDINLILDCNDKGVENVETQVSGCLSQLLEGGELEKTGEGGL
ncbi:F21J9.9 [Salix purpurea]|uniref:F21J9.9 n=1 Tax=Salix purpurea TaxID=77065 RepID=A0A9Q0WY22_SALPP|nr:F21J9.9 [Salix purpurea]